MHNSEAFYDCLSIVSQLEKPLSGVSRLDLQRLAFLACILSLYRGRPAADWGYRFARTQFGTPFSGEVSDGLEFLAAAGHITERDGRYSLTASGAQLRSTLS